MNSRHTGRVLTDALRFFSGILLIVAALCTPGASAQSPQKLTLDTVLGFMDAAARDFHSLTANVDHIKYTDVVKDTSKETGQLWLRKKDDKMRIEFSKPDPRTILRAGESLSIYNPKINRVEEYNLGKNRALVDQYLELGFGTRSENLRKIYQVSLTGEQDLDGKKTALLELVPKSEEVRAQISKVQVWIEEASWLPIQQKFFEAGSADYLIFHYSDLKKNLKIDESRFKQDWPKNATKVKPRG
jgi:outer membrane lipoprotein-sorting protein